MSNDDDDDDYEVGYGRPPREHQFKKGRSGNPKGRRKGTRNLKSDVINTLDSPVSIVADGQRRSVSTQKAMLLRLREMALKGNVRALDRYLTLAQIYNAEEIVRNAAAPVTDADKAIITRFLASSQGTSEDAVPCESAAEPDSEPDHPSPDGLSPKPRRRRRRL